MKLSDAILGAYCLVESRWNNAAWCSEGLEENTSVRSKKAFVGVCTCTIGCSTPSLHEQSDSETIVKYDTAETGWGEVLILGRGFEGLCASASAPPCRGGRPSRACNLCHVTIIRKWFPNMGMLSMLLVSANLRRY